MVLKVGAYDISNAAKVIKMITLTGFRVGPRKIASEF